MAGPPWTGPPNDPGLDKVVGATIGANVAGSTPNSLLVTDASGDFASGPLTSRVVTVAVPAAAVGEVLTSTAIGSNAGVWSPPSGNLGDRLPFSYQPGRRVIIDFGNSSRALDELAISGAGGGDWTFGTDPGDSARPCLLNSAVAYPAIYTVTTKSAWRNVDVSMRYRAAPSGASYHPSTFLALAGRLDSGQIGAAGTTKNAVSLQKDWNPATHELTLGMQVNNTNPGTGIQELSPTAEPDTTATTPRRMRLRIIDGFLQAKSWLESSGEPDWQLACELDGATHGTTAVNILEYGFAQLAFQPVNAGDEIYITELSFTELLPNGDSFWPNGDLQLANIRTGFPAYYTPVTTGAGVADVQSVPDRYGVTRPALHLHAPGNGDQAGWDLSQIGARSKNFYGTPSNWRIGPDDFGGAIEISLWSKGDVANPGGGTYGAAWVSKLYAPDGTDLALAAGGGVDCYSFGLGTISASGGGVGGTGTWDWTQSVIRLTPLPGGYMPKIASIIPVLVMHDPTAAGDVYVHDIKCRIVA